MQIKIENTEEINIDNERHDGDEGYGEYDEEGDYKVEVMRSLILLSASY